MIDSVSKKLENENKKQNGEFRSMLAGTLVAGLSAKIPVRVRGVKGTNEKTIRAAQDLQCCLILYLFLKYMGT